MSVIAEWRKRLRPWRWWLAAAALLVAVRVALPIVLRSVATSQASAALGARVEIGDVDLRLWRGGVALEDVALWPADAPVAPAAQARGDEPPPAFPENAPMIAFRRFAIELRYLPLFSKRIQLRDVALEGPRVALDRLDDGNLNVMALVPSEEVAVEAGATPGETPAATPNESPVAVTPSTAAAETTPGEAMPAGTSTATPTDTETPTPPQTQTPTPTSEASPGSEGTPADTPATPSADGATPPATPAARAEPEGGGWSYGLDQFVLRNGRLRFRDLALEGSEPVEVGIEEVYVDEIALAPEVYGEPARIHLKLGVDEGAIDVNARLVLAGDDVTVVTDIDANRLPLRRARLYVPNVGWSDLRGELDMALNYELRPREKNELGGTFALRDVAVTVPNLEEVAISWESLAVAIQSIDLLGQRAAVSDVTLTGALVTVRASGDEPLPWLAPSGPTPVPTPSPAPSAAARPWDWSLAKLKIESSKIHVLSDQPPVAVGVDLDASGLGGGADTVGHAALALALDPGSLDLEGDLKIANPAFGGTLKIADLSVPPLLALSGALPPEALASAKLRADLAVSAGLPAKTGGAAPADRLELSGTIGLADVDATLPTADRVALAMRDLDLAIERASIPGIIPLGATAPPDARLALDATLSLADPRVEIGADEATEVEAATLVLKASPLDVPASLAGLAPPSAVPVANGGLSLELGAPNVTLAGDTTVQARRIALALRDVALPILAPGGVADAAAPPARVGLSFETEGATVAIAAGEALNAAAESIALDLNDVVIPGFVAGAPPPAESEPIRAAAKLAIAKPRVARGDGKEFAFNAASVEVPLGELSLPASIAFGSPAPGAVARALRASFGEVQLDRPVIVVTRTKDGIILPGASAGSAPPAAPAAEPAPAERAAAPPLALDIQAKALRVRRGKLSFTDRAVDPLFATKVSPIEIDAQNVRYPGPVIDPLRIDLGTEPDGSIELAGKLAPGAGKVDLSIKHLALGPFNSYATTYSPYSIEDGALSLTTTITSAEGNYNVKNDLTLHQLEMSGGEDEAGFEKQFGISLSLALALLRDMNGDIALGVPVDIHREGGTRVDAARVVRSALRRAITGAIQSPLKMLGAVAGGKKKLSLAPAPIAFRRGRAQPTKAGAKSLELLTGFLNGRPTLGLELSSWPTDSDARWMHEQALRAKWKDENVFRRSIGFITARGPRERVGSYLRARAKDKKATLSDEDRAQLDAWLAEIPAPTPDELRTLAENRLSVVEGALTKAGIAAERIAKAGPSGEAKEGKPVAMFKLRTSETDG